MSLFRGEKPFTGPLEIQHDGSSDKALSIKSSDGTVVMTVDSAGAVSTLVGGTLTGDTTVASGKTLAVTTADLLTVGGIIVPQHQVLVSQTISLHASKVVYNVFVASSAWQVTNIYYVPDIAQGGALTATVVKAVSTATPASATTPMHSAGGIDLNGTAHTVQTISLTATTADLQLAAGNRIGLVLSGAMTVGSGLLVVRGKRI